MRAPVTTAHVDLEREVENLREQLQAVSWLADPEKAERVMRGLELLESLEKRRKE